MSELLPWLNLLLLPGVGLLMSINSRLAVLETRQQDHGRRLDALDSDVGELQR